MKKPVLAAVGVAGACAACCAIPLLVPLVGGVSVGSLIAMASGDWWGLSSKAPVIASVIAVAVLVGVATWLARRRRSSAFCTVAPTVVSRGCATVSGAGAGAGGCGCPAPNRPALSSGVQK